MREMQLLRNKTRGDSAQPIAKLVLLLVPLALAIAMQAPVLRLNHIADYDESIHLDCARSILRTGLPIRRIGEGQIYFNHPPLFQYVLAGFQAVVGGGLFTGRLLSAGFLIATVILVYAIALELSPQRKQTPNLAPAVAASLIAVHPLMVSLGTSVKFEMMLTALICGSCFAVLLAERRQSLWLYWISGALLGLALLTKALGLVFLGTLWVYWLARYRLQAFRMSAPYVVTGTALVLFSAGFLFGLLTDQGLFLASFSRWVGRANAAVDARAGLTWLAWLGQIGHEVFGVVFALLLVPALVRGLQRAKSNPQVGLLALYVVLGLGASFALSIKEVRHLLPLIPSAAIVLALALDEWLLLPLFQRAGKTTLALVLWAVLVLLCSPLSISWRVTLRSPATWFDQDYRSRSWDADRNGLALRWTGEWLGRATARETRIATVRAGTVEGYYADRNYDLLYVNDYGGVKALVEHSTVLVLDIPLKAADALPLLSAAEREEIQALVNALYIPVHRVRYGLRDVMVLARDGSPLAEAGLPQPLELASGVYEAEVTPDGRVFQWTNGSACAEARQAGDYGRVTVSLSAIRPSAGSPVSVSVRLNDTDLGAVAVGATWQQYEFEIPAAVNNRDSALVCIISDTIDESEFRSSTGNRTLGTMVGELALLK